VGQLVERVADLERHFALSGKAVERISGAAARILGRRQRLTSLDLEGMGEAAGSAAVAEAVELPAKRLRG
jgi:DNA recombination protein RmuC